MSSKKEIRRRKKTKRDRARRKIQETKVILGKVDQRFEEIEEILNQPEPRFGSKVKTYRERLDAIRAIVSPKEKGKMVVGKGNGSL